MGSTCDFLGRLGEIAGPAGLLTDMDAMAPHLVDWRGQFRGRADAVVRPRSTAEVAAIVRACGEFQAAIVPQGGNTGLAGGATPTPAGRQIVLALGRMNRVRDLDPLDNLLVAEAGCVLQTLQTAAVGAGRLLPLSFGAEGSAQIGGAIATNAGGVNVLRYGSTRQLVLGLEVVLPDGTVLERLGRLRKDNAGYDWKQVFIGSEGTLGIITAASLRLYPKPAQSQTAMVSVGSPGAALRLFERIDAELGEFLSSFELVSEAAYRVSLDHLPGASFPFSEGWVVLVELTAGSPDLPLGEVLEATLARAFEDGCALDAVIAQTVAQAQALWLVRESIADGERAAGVSVKHDVSVPISRIADLIAAVERGAPELFPGARPNIFGHVGDGNMHVNIILSPQQATDPTVAHRLNDYVHDLVAAEGGSITAEHGIGQYRRDELYKYKTVAELRLMEQFKQLLDPRNLMNPGKVIQVEPG
ncbi:MAG: dependent oxidoreductase [Caulobacteraceae bacterium]|nr:dependent oxidoreductase [Caulobacteraceae bacterium]